MAVTYNGKNFVDLTRIMIRFNNIGLIDKEKIGDALKNVGDLIAREARVIAKKEDILTTGQLINSINARLSFGNSRYTMTVGPKSVPYAVFQELGAQRTPASRAAMFARLREIGRLGDRGPRPGFSQVFHAPRPFMSPAFHRHAYKIIDMLREAFKE